MFSSREGTAADLTTRRRRQLYLLVLIVVLAAILAGFSWPARGLKPKVALPSDIKFSTEARPLQDASAAVSDLGAPLKGVLDDAPSKLIVYQLPDLWFPSGRVVAADGFIMDKNPFTRRIEPGRYPLQLVVAKSSADERVAFAILRFAKTPVAKWEMALTEGEDVSKLTPDSIYGYGVDSGTGCFCDPAAKDLIDRALGSDSTSYDAFYARLTEELQKSYQHTRDWARIETTRGSIALFSSGLGDGSYASYFGLDAAGHSVALLTDFDVLKWPRRPEPRRLRYRRPFRLSIALP